MFVGSGISLGAIGAGIAAAQLVEPFGWRAVFVVGGVLPLLLAALLARFLPESIRFAAVLPSGQAEAKRLLRKIKPELGADGDIEIVSDDPEGGKATVADLFKDGRGVATLCLWVAFFMSLLNVYLAINWLPTSLNASGFTQTQASVMTTLYHVGGVIGTYAIGLLMDRLGAHRMVLVALLLAAIGFYTFATATGHDAVADDGDPDARRRRRHRRASRRHGARVDDAIPSRCARRVWAGRSASAASARSSARRSAASCWRRRPMRARSISVHRAGAARHGRRGAAEAPSRAGAATGRRELNLERSTNVCVLISASNASPPKRRSRRRTSFAPTASCSRAKARTTSASTA